MIDRDGILKTLKKLDDEYLKSVFDPDLPIFYSKLAVIELCGWIETSYDNILYDYIDRRILDSECKKIIKGFVKKNNGFAFDSNTYQTFSIVLGADNWENILDKLGSPNKNKFESILTKYKDIRNKAAHTNILSSTLVFDSPSITKTDFLDLFPIMQLIETEVGGLV